MTKITYRYGRLWLRNRVFLIRKFWENERPSSTEYETESSYYPESEAETEKGEDHPVKEIIDPFKILDPTATKFKVEIERLQCKIQNCEQSLKNRERVISQLELENTAVNNERIELQNELITSKSRISQLESENRKHEREKQKYITESQQKQAKLQSFEERCITLIKCKCNC